jgi:FKBP-type peptidyl-prolyl cis-trans isomerase
MASKTPNSTRILSIMILIIFGTSLVAAFAIPLMTKDEKEQQQADLQKQIEELQGEEATEAEELEVDPNLRQAGDITTMQIIDITTGTGQEVKLGDKITVKYKGALASTGQVFDSNDEGVEFPLEVGGLIEGWTEGVPGMKVGGKRKLVIPSEKGYGARGSSPSIPPDADLVFEIELVAVS